MADLRGFDANSVEPSTDFEPLPAGIYEVVLIESEQKPTKSGTGSYLQLVFEVIAGPHKGRRLWARMNLDNPNATAVAIARAELAALCRAVHVLTPNDSIELHDIPLFIKVGLKKRSDTQELQNEVRGYSSKSSPVQTATVKTSPAGTGTQTAPPWKR